jgi:hypothetical protein
LLQQRGNSASGEDLNEVISANSFAHIIARTIGGGHPRAMLDLARVRSIGSECRRKITATRWRAPRAIHDQGRSAGQKSGSRRRVVPDQASSCLSVGHPRNDAVDQTSAYLRAQFRIRSFWTASLPILWSANISTRKNEAELAIAIVAAILVTIVTLPYSQPAVAVEALPVDRG